MVVCRIRYFLLAVMMLACCSAYCRQSPDMLNRLITLPTQKVRLDTLLQTITRQTGIRFSYNSKRLNTAYKLTLNKRKVTVQEALDLLKSKTNVLYSLIENHVILNIEKSTIKKDPLQKPVEAGPAIKPTSLSPAPSGQPEKTSGELPQSADTASAGITPEKKSVVNDTIFSSTQNAALPVKDSVNETVAVATPTRDTASQKASTVLKRISPPKKSGYFIDLGFSSEETLFFGTTLRTGTPTFFGTLSLKSNGRSAILLYGLSGVLHSGNRSRVILNTYFGTYTKSLRTTTESLDSIKTNHKIVVSGLWIGMSTGVEWKLNSAGSWKLFAGLSFNGLQSKYNVDGKNQGLSGLPGSNPERKYSAFYPFYSISNTYDDSRFESLKTWIGVQVGIYRTIFSK